MGTEQRLNGVIAKLERGEHVWMAFQDPTVEAAKRMAGSELHDGVIFDMEHRAFNPVAFPDCLNALKPDADTKLVTPIVRIPAKGIEMNVWMAGHFLDMGALGTMFPYIEDFEQAYRAVAASRYSTPENDHFHEPKGRRGAQPRLAVKYLGLSDAAAYIAIADPWRPPKTYQLDDQPQPKRELLTIIQIENTDGIDGLPKILDRVKGISAVVIGENDLSRSLGVAPEQYDDPVLRDAMLKIVGICKDYGVPVGHPHIDKNNAKRAVEEGYGILICPPDKIRESRAASGLK